jgi:hypothetical protein
VLGPARQKRLDGGSKLVIHDRHVVLIPSRAKLAALSPARMTAVPETQLLDVLTLWGGELILNESLIQRAEEALFADGFV